MASSSSSSDTRKRTHAQMQQGGSSNMPPDEEVLELELLDPQSLRKRLLVLEKRINKNLEQRVKFAKQPEKFVDSEVDLHEELQQLIILAAQPELFPDLFQLKFFESLVSLMSHENSDVVADVLDLLSDITAPENCLGEFEDNAAPLCEILIENGMLQCIVNILEEGKFDEQQAEELQAIKNALEILDNMLTICPDQLLSENIPDELLRYLVETLTKKLEGISPTMTEPPELTAELSELLASILAVSDKARIWFGTPTVAKNSTAENNGANSDNQVQAQSFPLDDVLKILSRFRKISSGSFASFSDVVENVFQILGWVLLEKSGRSRDLFRKLEGFELLCLLLKSEQELREPSLSLIDSALVRNPANVVQFVRCGGLRLVFPLLSKGKKKYDNKCIAIIDKCLNFSLTPTVSETYQEVRERILHKFEENSFEKVSRITELFLKHRSSLQDFDPRAVLSLLRKENPNASPEDIKFHLYVEKLNAGLDQLQQLCCILAHIIEVHRSAPGLISRITQTEGFSKQFSDFSEFERAMRSILAEMQQHLESNDTDMRRIIETLLKSLSPPSLR